MSPMGLGQMPPDFTASFNTPLRPKQESAFQAWLKRLSRAKGYDAALDLQDYDLRGAFKAGAKADPRGHLTDEFKKPNHPTFSSESIYSSPAAPGGVWSDSGDDRWSFLASPTNLHYRTKAAIEDYFRRVEPDAIPRFPEEFGWARR